MGEGPYRRNHYVPKWYQRRFFPDGMDEQKFFYLDLKPDTFLDGRGTTRRRNALRRIGPPNAFKEDDLYTTKSGAWESTEIEEKLFGKIDFDGKKAVEYFSEFQHPSINSDALLALLRYMSIQKSRTPKGLLQLSRLAGTDDHNQILMIMQEYQEMHCAVWTESIWSIADASQTTTKFILSDHPVTVYNESCPPQSRWCRNNNDPDIRLVGTHTLFPLSIDKILIFTNLSWIRDHYCKSTKPRPNPDLFRPTFFSFLSIQVGRELTEIEINEINFIIKQQAYRYIAAPRKEWLYPEENIRTRHWRNLGNGLLLMPDPRSVVFSREVVIGYSDHAFDSFDEYGRKPGDPDFKDDKQADLEWKTFLRFQGRFARLYGPRRRGRSFNFHRLDNEEDNSEYHRYHLTLEKKF